ncbi:hypothetical protein AXG93_3102s1450 [Marchantia polymorpha subsp. ruderalis]|uniref:Legume lectin domain-containing protein n=1 Tax=Marchantia polymorpha subsp. ruderalis TaxID=1480154 RepID=A0A176W885_MARPO|nr:hypothetical protein AXG93_3102s1450 [Marchantia polymorpha subsp. ruderalis]
MVEGMSMSNPRPEGCARLEQMSERRTPALALLVLVQLVSSSVAETYEDRTTLRSAQGTCGSFPAIFSFGSSVADTGAGVLLRADSPAGSFPYGIDFPAPRSGRWSNGRLLVDLWAEAFGLPHLDPFLKAMRSSFSHGANFACGGSRVTASKGSGPVTLNLEVQVYQFKMFKRGVLAADGCPDGERRPPFCSNSL